MIHPSFTSKARDSDEVPEAIPFPPAHIMIIADSATVSVSKNKETRKEQRGMGKSDNKDNDSNSAYSHYGERIHNKSSIPVLAIVLVLMCNVHYKLPFKTPFSGRQDTCLAITPYIGYSAKSPKNNSNSK